MSDSFTLTAAQRLYCEVNKIPFDKDKGTIDSTNYEKIRNLTNEQLTQAISQASDGKKTIEIGGKTYNFDFDDKKFYGELRALGYTEEEIEGLKDLQPDQLALSIKAKAQLHKNDGRTDDVLLLDADRYAKIDNFKKQAHLKGTTEDKLKEQFPQDQYPDLYKKNGSIKERQAWNAFEDNTTLEFYNSTKFEDPEKFKEWLNGLTPEAKAKAIKDIKKAEDKIQQKLNNGCSVGDLTPDEQELYHAREAAHEFKKDNKKFSKNVDKSIERINHAIDKMNAWDWSMLNKEQQTKIVSEYRKYMNDQNKANPNGTQIEDIFDDSGNLKEGKKNHLYQFVADYVTGTDAQVNKSKKKGNFFQKIFSKRNKEGTEKWAARQLGLNKKDIENMGFDWENQISLGAVLLDGVPAALMGAAFGAAVSKSDQASDSKTATASVDEQIINETKPYSGYVDYLVNGELVQQIPYNGVVKFTKKIAGAFDSQTANAEANANVNAILPAMLISSGAAMLNSLYTQGVDAQEKDVFNDNLYNVLSKKGETSLSSPDDVLKYAGVKPDSQEGRMAREIAGYYFDEKTGKFDKQTFLTDWQYNGGYNSNYLNKQEAAVWLDQLRKNGPKKPPEVEVNVNIPPQIKNTIAYDINHGGLVADDVNGTLYINDYQQQYGDGWSIDEGVNKRNKVTTAYQKDQQVAGNAQGQVGWKAQAVYASADDEGIKVEPREINGKNDFAQPKTITLKDKTNDGEVHTFTYELMTEHEISSNNLTKTDGKPFYKLVSVTNEQGQTIRNPRSNIEVYRLDLEDLGQQNVLSYDNVSKQYVNTSVKRFKYNLKQDDPSYPGYNTSSMNYGKYSTYMKNRR